LKENAPEECKIWNPQDYNALLGRFLKTLYHKPLHLKRPLRVFSSSQDKISDNLAV